MTISNSFVDALVRRLASFDRETLAAAKAQINRFGTPTATELQSSNDMFFTTLAGPVRRRAVPSSAPTIARPRPTGQGPAEYLSMSIAG